MPAKNKRGELPPTPTHQQHRILRRGKEERERPPVRWELEAQREEGRLMQRRKKSERRKGSDSECQNYT